MANKICKKGKISANIKDSNEHAIEKKASGNPRRAAKIKKAIEKKNKGKEQE